AFRAPPERRRYRPKSRVSFDFYRLLLVAYNSLSCPALSQPTLRTPPHSHSIVPGGLDVISYVTRLIPRTSFTIRPATRVKNPISNGYTSAVIPSVDVTARNAQALS